MIMFPLVSNGMVVDPVADSGRNPEPRTKLENENVKIYVGGDDGGLAHVTYWGLVGGNPGYDGLADEEKAKAAKINANYIHSRLFQPNNADIAGVEVSGVLDLEMRRQNITFRLPDPWNGKLVVAGTPGLRNEYANEAILVPWLLEEGYAYVSGDKGIPGGANDMLSGKHPTRHWGPMMIDLAHWGREYLKNNAGQVPDRTYVMGLSNGGYQARRALEIDHDTTCAKGKGNAPLFDGGVDWSGAYWPDARVMSSHKNGRVSVEDYAAAHTMVGSIDKATLAMGWAYSDNTLNIPGAFYENPAYPGAYLDMIEVGFSPESAVFWGYYNSYFDCYKDTPGFEFFRGVGHYNLVSYLYRADLRGDDASVAAAYSCYADPGDDEAVPPLYDWLVNADNNGWNKESVKYALKNANTGEFSAPLLSLHGQADGLLALSSMGVDYKNAVARFGNPDLHRLYIIASRHVGVRHIGYRPRYRWSVIWDRKTVRLPGVYHPWSSKSSWPWRARTFTGTASSWRWKNARMAR